MSYDIQLMHGDRIAEVPLHSEGGTQLIGGCSEARLNVTFNYSPYFYEHLGDDEIHWLQGKRADQTIPKLEGVVDALSPFLPNKDYWKLTAGNARKALSILLNWARLHPGAIWNVIG